MREDEFRRWLQQQEYAANAINTYLSNARAVERGYGDLDQLYERDQFTGLMAEFTYSATDKRANKPNPTKLKLWGNTYRDLGQARSILNTYRSFLLGRASTRVGLSPPDRSAVEKAMDEYSEIGATLFMETYRFSWSNVVYFAMRDGTPFPAKAIFAVAHQYMPSGAPLDSTSVDGTEAHQHLASLGYEISKRGPIVLFGKDGQTYEPAMQTAQGTGRKAYRFKPAGASNRTEEAVETTDVAELARALFVDGLAARISPANGGGANYLTYRGQKFSHYWLRPDIAELIGKKSSNATPSPTPKAPEIAMSTPSNIILHGPPGTGKTWRSAREAVSLCDGSAPEDRNALMERYRALQAEKRVAFVTFHQSMDYESFVEGLRPETENSDGSGTGFRLEARSGVFREICTLAEHARQAPKNASAGIDLEARRFWKMGLGAIGAEDEVYESANTGNYIVLGWGGNIDWSDPRYENEDEVEKTWKEKNPSNNSPSNYTQLWPFRARMKKGDIVVVPYGNSAFRAVAEITGDYQYVPSGHGTYNHRRNVRWLLKLAEPLPLDTIIEGNFTMRTLYPIAESRINKSALKRLLPGDERAASGRPEQFVLIIDEINRANVSKVLGELITLIEPDKRLGQPNALEVLLPYSRKSFGVPDNLHIIGTMNTADRSIALLDTALRRRFKFIEIEPDPDTLLDAANATGLPLDTILKAMNDRIEYLLDREHRIGHAFFIGCHTREDVDRAMHEKVLPLLQEYFFEDWGRVAAVLGEQAEPSAKNYRGSFLECRRLADPTGNGGVDRLSWSIRRKGGGPDFAENAYESLVASAWLETDGKLIGGDPDDDQ